MHLKQIDLHPERYPTTEHYPFNLDILRTTRTLRFDCPVTFFIGENGSGKSTLLDAITRKCGIMMWQGMQRARYKASPYEKDLHRAIDVQWRDKRVPGSFFGSHIFQNFAQLWDEWLTMDPGLIDYMGGKSLMSQSHGQSLMAFFTSRFKIKGIYFLDEPETALSPKSQLELLKLLEDLSRTGLAQFVIATHSPILLACRDAEILNFDESPIKAIKYEDTDLYRIYRDFMTDPHGYLGLN
jgi:predicted ATPase